MKLKTLKKTLSTIFEGTDFVCAFDLTSRDVIVNHDMPFFDEWRKQGKHAGMAFLEKNSDVRMNPNLILENAKSALVFLFPYAHGARVRHRKEKHENKLENQNDNQSENQIHAVSNSIIEKKLISKYAYSKDYHKIIKKNLLRYASALEEKLQIKFDSRPIVDSVPFFERAYGREGGLGFVGKNTLLIRPGVGSFFFIGTLLTNLDFDILTEETTKKNPIFSLDCGECNRCVEACPTQAIESQRTLNSNKCLSYLTIEHRDVIEHEFAKHLDKTIYGCDICQNVCPYNFVTEDVSMLTEFKKVHDSFLTLTVEDMARMTEVQYQKWFGGTAMTRARYEGLVRNALYHLYATGSVELPQILNNLENSSYSLIQKTVQQILLWVPIHE